MALLPIFQSEYTLRNEQRTIAGRLNARGPSLSDAMRRELIEDEREVREHARMRSLAFILIGPAVVALMFAISEWVVVILARP